MRQGILDNYQKGRELFYKVVFFQESLGESPSKVLSQSIQYLNSAVLVFYQLEQFNAIRISDYETLRMVYIILARAYDQLGQAQIAAKWRKYTSDLTDKTPRKELKDESQASTGTGSTADNWEEKIRNYLKDGAEETRKYQETAKTYVNLLIDNLQPLIDVIKCHYPRKHHSTLVAELYQRISFVLFPKSKAMPELCEISFSLYKTAVQRIPIKNSFKVDITYAVSKAAKLVNDSMNIKAKILRNEARQQKDNSTHFYFKGLSFMTEVYSYNPDIIKSNHFFRSISLLFHGLAQLLPDHTSERNILNFLIDLLKPEYIDGAATQESFETFLISLSQVTRNVTKIKNIMEMIKSLLQQPFISYLPKNLFTQYLLESNHTEIALKKIQAAMDGLSVLDGCDELDRLAESEENADAKNTLSKEHNPYLFKHIFIPFVGDANENFNSFLIGIEKHVRHNNENDLRWCLNTTFKSVNIDESNRALMVSLVSDYLSAPNLAIKHAPIRYSYSADDKIRLDPVQSQLNMQVLYEQLQQNKNRKIDRTKAVKQLSSSTYSKVEVKEKEMTDPEKGRYLLKEWSELVDEKGGPVKEKADPMKEKVDIKYGVNRPSKLKLRVLSMPILRSMHCCRPHKLDQQEGQDSHLDMINIPT